MTQKNILHLRPDYTCRVYIAQVVDYANQLERYIAQLEEEMEERLQEHADVIAGLRVQHEQELAKWKAVVCKEMKGGSLP